MVVVVVGGGAPPRGATATTPRPAAPAPRPAVAGEVLQPRHLFEVAPEARAAAAHVASAHREADAPDDRAAQRLHREVRQRCCDDVRKRRRRR